MDVRISTLPTVHGEKMVLRMLDRNAAIHSVHDLGFAAEPERVLELLDRPQGISSPPDRPAAARRRRSHALLKHNASQERNYVTIEDPVEYSMPGASQVAVHERIGLDFATALRSVLRQDPDVILLGEIRDAETATVAFHAAMTGHKVYSTLHELVGRGAVTPLRTRAQGHFIATARSTASCRSAVRRICDECREPDQPDPVLLARLGAPSARPAWRRFADAAARTAGTPVTAGARRSTNCS